MEKIINFIVAICFVAIHVFVYLFVYQILVVLGLEHNSAGELSLLGMWVILYIIIPIIGMFVLPSANDKQVRR